MSIIMFGVHNQSKDRHLYIFIISTYRLGMATSCVCVRNLWLGVISMSIAHLHFQAKESSVVQGTIGMYSIIGCHISLGILSLIFISL